MLLRKTIAQHHCAGVQGGKLSVKMYRFHSGTDLYDFELILVEDGSPDGCPALCDAAAAKDARIRVLHQKRRAFCCPQCRAGCGKGRVDRLCGFRRLYCTGNVRNTVQGRAKHRGRPCPAITLRGRGRHTSPAAVHRALNTADLYRAGTAEKSHEYDGAACVEQAVPPRYLCAAALPGGQAERGYFLCSQKSGLNTKKAGGAKGAVLLCAARQQHYERK